MRSAFPSAASITPPVYSLHPPLHNWQQGLYLCILYDKWLDPPIWDFVGMVVKAFRRMAR